MGATKEGMDELIPEVYDKYEYDKENFISTRAVIKSRIQKLLLDYVTKGHDLKKLSEGFDSLINRYTDKKLKYQFVQSGESDVMIRPLDNRTTEIFNKLGI